MVTLNILLRVFLLKFGGQIGTAFTIDYNNRQYLVTAAHVTDGAKAPFVFEIFHDGKWQQLPFQLTGKSPTADIVVYAPTSQISISTTTHSLALGSNDLVMGQDAHFLGFPYGLYNDAGTLSANFPLPLIKKACISGFQRTPDGTKIWVLDGMNNPGFSGGPVVFVPPGRPMTDLRVMAVVSGFRYDDQAAILNGQLSPIMVRQNTGIIVSYDISYAIDEIKKNENGPQLTY